MKPQEICVYQLVHTATSNIVVHLELIGDRSLVQNVKDKTEWTKNTLTGLSHEQLSSTIHQTSIQVKYSGQLQTWNPQARRKCQQLNTRLGHLLRLLSPKSVLTVITKLTLHKTLLRPLWTTRTAVGFYQAHPTSSPPIQNSSDKSSKLLTQYESDRDDD